MKNYPEHYQQLKQIMKQLKQEIPDTMAGFAGLHRASATDGALSPKTKELIALGIAISVRCDGCIAFHMHDALRAKATKAEIMETIGVAIMMGGGPSLMYACEAMEALNQFESQK